MNDPAMTARLKKLRLPVVIIVVTVVVIAGLMATRPRLTPVEKPERVWPVAVVEARHATVQPEVTLFGEVVAGRRSELRPLVSGLIVEIGTGFFEGGRVSKGDLLVQIDPFDYQTDLAEQKSLLREARAKLEKLGRDLDRAKELFAENNVSEQFLDDARLAVIEQEALVEQREIAVRRADRDLADTRLVAPFDGVLSGVNADLGKQFTGFGDNKVADLIDTSQLEVRFSLSNAQFGRLLEATETIQGRPVEVEWRIGKRVLAYPGRVTRVGAEITSTTGGVDAYAVIDSGGEQVTLRPGAFVAVKIADKEYREVLQAPDTALYGEDLVYLIEDQRMSPRRILIQGYSGSDMLFTSAGEPAIRDGDLIITTQLREGGTGAKVSVR